MTAKQISDALGVSVQMVTRDDWKMGSDKASNTIFLHPRYMPYFDRRVRVIPYWRTRQAKYVFFLAHEMGHIHDTEPYAEFDPAHEARINHWAARNFIKIARKLGFTSEGTVKLWKALPKHYREA